MPQRGRVLSVVASRARPSDIGRVTSAVPTGVNRAHSDFLRACQAGHPREVESFLDHDEVPIDAPDAFGRTALMLCCAADGHQPGAEEEPERLDTTSHSRRETAQVLLDKGARVNALGPGGWTPLFYATFYCQEPIVRLLVSYKADVNHLDESDRDASAWARYGDSNQVSLKSTLKPLVTAGAVQHIDALVKRGEVNECAFLSPLVLDAASEQLLRKAAEEHGGRPSIPM